MTGYLVNRQYGWTRDYAPKFWLVAFCMKRLTSTDKPLTAEALNADWQEIDRQYAADVGIKKGTVGMTPLQCQPVVLGQHTWFTDPTLASADLYVTAISPSTLLAVRGESTGTDPRTRAEYRRLVELAATRTSFAP